MAPAHSDLSPFPLERKGKTNKHVDYFFSNSHFCGQCYGFVSHTRLLLIQCVGFHLCVFFTCVYFYNICFCVSSLVSFSIRNKK